MDARQRISEAEMAYYLAAGQRFRSEAFQAAGRAGIAISKRALAWPWQQVKKAIDGYRDGRKRRLAITQLRSLDDRLLKDIGIGRSEIVGAVDGIIELRGRTSSARSGEVVPLYSTLPEWRRDPNRTVPVRAEILVAKEQGNEPLFSAAETDCAACG